MHILSPHLKTDFSRQGLFCVSITIFFAKIKTRHILSRVQISSQQLKYISSKDSFTFEN